MLWIITPTHRLPELFTCLSVFYRLLKRCVKFCLNWFYYAIHFTTRVEKRYMNILENLNLKHISLLPLRWFILRTKLHVTLQYIIWLFIFSWNSAQGGALRWRPWQLPQCGLSLDGFSLRFLFFCLVKEAPTGTNMSFHPWIKSSHRGFWSRSGSQWGNPSSTMLQSQSRFSLSACLYLNFY